MNQTNQEQEKQGQHTPMDEWTKKHLLTWCQHHAPSVEEPEDIAAMMQAFMESTDDVEFWLNRGWGPVYDHVDNICAAHAGERS